MTKWQSVATRFAKGFIAGGLSSVSTYLAAGVTVASFDDIYRMGLALATSFFVGGFLALEKWYSWVE